MAAARRHIHPGEIVEAGGVAVIDGEMLRAPGLDHIAEGREGVAAERLDRQLQSVHDFPPLRLQSAIAASNSRPAASSHSQKERA